MKSDLNAHHIQKITSKWNKDQCVRADTIKFLEEHININSFRYRIQNKNTQTQKVKVLPKLFSSFNKIKLATPLPFTLCHSYPYFLQTLFCAVCLCGQWQVKHGGWLVGGHGRVWMEKGKRSSSHNDTMIRRWPIKCQLTRPN